MNKTIHLLQQQRMATGNVDFAKFLSNYKCQPKGLDIGKVTSSCARLHMGVVRMNQINAKYRYLIQNEDKFKLSGEQMRSYR